MDELPPTEAANPSTADLDALETRALLARINAEDRTAAAAVERALDSLTAAVDSAVSRLRAGGRLHYFGAGTSGRLGVLDAAELPPTFSTDPSLVVAHIAGGEAAMTRAVEGAEDDADAGRADVAAANIGSSDVALGLSASGSAAFVVAAIEASAEHGALTIAITCDPRGALARAARIAIVLETGAETLTGSTRMKAAAAQKMALTAFSTAIMVRLGKVYRNLMVDVSPTNRKLRARALRLTQLASGASREDAERALRESGGRVKIAAYMLARSVDARRAEEALDKSDGSLRSALEFTGDSQK
ncbi:MAG TPA: N-acetylmuramic acid 6-phosphate etherase [Candidatus Eremiobacteraceae bacterium]|nr:N-acetylmuramic acid 6-phosphate etherase [Candidatus Eremiobacteraceae bacterium]